MATWPKDINTDCGYSKTMDPDLVFCIFLNSDACQVAVMGTNIYIKTAGWPSDTKVLI